jgi:predicted nucleic acid-binding protein
MSEVYVLDACAMLAVLYNEAGADVVGDYYKKAVSGEAKVIVNKVNLLEVYYDLYRSLGKTQADSFIVAIQNTPIIIYSEMSDAVFTEAGRLKATYRISLADAVALAEVAVSSGALITSDHHEFDIVEKSENISFAWFR